MKKSFLVLASFAAIAVGCQVEKMDELPLVDNSVVYTASTEAYAPSTKTAMDGLDVVWSENDYLAVFQGNVLADKFVVSDGVGTTSGNFTLDTEGEDYTSMDFNLAVYPYADDLMVTPDWDVNVHMLPIVVSSVQDYTKDTFADESFPMVAVTNSVDDKEFAFKNVFGAMKLQLTGTKIVKSVVVSGANSEILAGQFMVLIENGIPSVMPGDYPKYTSVSVDCGEGVQLNESEATNFYIALPPTTFENGFTVTVIDNNNKQYKINARASENNVIERSKILVMPEVDVDDIVSPVDLVSVPGITDAELEITLNETDAVGFYGIYSSAENWAGYRAMFTQTEYFDMLISGGLIDMGVPCTYYEGKSFEGSLAEFGYSSEYLDMGYVNMVAPGSTSYVIVIPVYEGVETYTLDDAIEYEIYTSALTVGGTVALPEYEVVSDYTTVTVNFEASANVVYATYGFFEEGETLPTTEDCLETMWLTPDPLPGGGFTMSEQNSYNVLPGAAYTLCVMVADKDGNAQLHVIEDVATKEIPYDTTLEVVISDVEYVNDSGENEIWATVNYPETTVELYYLVNNSASYTEYSAATQIAQMLNGNSNWKKATLEDDKTSVEISATAVGNNYADKINYVHVVVITSDGKSSVLKSSEGVNAPKRN